MSLIRKIFIVFMLVSSTACGDSGSEPADGPQQATPSAGPQAERGEPAGEAGSVQDGAESLEQTLRDIEVDMGLKIFNEPWTGDFDVMAEKRLIRVLTVYGLGRYYLDGVTEKGLTYELFKMFEKFVNEKMNTGTLKIHVVILPVARDQLLPALVGGRGDIVAAGLTITPERLETVDFSDPVSKPLSEILVTGPSAPPLGTLEDLSGQTVYVRASSSYRSSLNDLNSSFEQQGLAPVDIQDASELLEDEDLLEMVNAGLLEWAVVDDYKAEIWADVFEDLTVRKDLVLRKGGQIGMAFRKDSPKLAALLNEFLKSNKQGSLTGNILINRYYRDFDWAGNALSQDDFQRFQDVVDIFTKFGDQYGVDYLMVAAQGYQESGLDQSARSPAGAIGIMQLLPSTAKDPNVGIDDITTAENNIHAGVKYLDFIRQRYFADPDIDQFNRTMFAFAAYNAGPARVRQLRDKAEQQGYDPNQWFDNVEVIAAREIGRETVQYVSNILKYYVAYSLTIRQQLEREAARQDAGVE